MVLRYCAGGSPSPLRREVVGSDRSLSTIRWRRSDSVLWRVVLDDAVLLPTDGDHEPFALAGGRRLWEALAESRRLDELVSILGATAMEKNLAELLTSLVEAGVVERTPD